MPRGGVLPSIIIRPEIARDVVSRAIFSHLQKTSDNPAHAKVYLDLRQIRTGSSALSFPQYYPHLSKMGH
jgi:L-aspartate oxidase